MAMAQKINFKTPGDLLYYKRLAKIHQQHINQLNEWEFNFVVDLLEVPPHSFTDKQKQVISKIYERFDHL